MLLWLRSNKGIIQKNKNISEKSNFWGIILADITEGSNLTFRPGRIDDVNEVGKIIFDAFTSPVNKHHFPSDFPTPNAGIDAASYFYPILDFIL